MKTEEQQDTQTERPLVIVGPTASGKSALALEVAKTLGVAEIVSVDAMQVYRNMDIGTDTPTITERSIVPHHMINLVDPSEEFTVVEFQLKAKSVLKSIQDRGNIPVLVGGSGLYIRAVVDDLNIPGRYPRVRSVLEMENDTTILHDRLSKIDAAAAVRIEPTNRRRILRALEVTLGSGKLFSSYGPGIDSYPSTQFVMIGLQWPLVDIDRRIRARLQRQIDEGFLEEVEKLSNTTLSKTAAKAIGYQSLSAHMNGELSLDEALEDVFVRTRQFARRQMRWFKRDPRIVWIDAPVEVSSVLATWKSS